MSSPLTISEVRFEHRRDALGIGINRPRLSWINATSTQGWRQVGYEIESYDAHERFLTTTGSVTSDQSVFIDWPFPSLVSRERRLVRIRTWGSDGETSMWSEMVSVEAGLLSENDWTAHFVTPDWDEDTNQPQPATYMRGTFNVQSPITQARLYITALGVYEAQINGEIIGDEVLAPGWTSYRHRLRYQVFDITDRVQVGPNALGAIIGDGWYRGRIGFEGGRRNQYGSRLALLAQIEILYADGTTQRVETNESWRAARGPILMNDLYNGETYDARLEHDGWLTPTFDDQRWAGVRLHDWDLRTLVASSGPPVRRIETLRPIAITTSPSGKTILDFGQNLVGRVRFAVQGAAGQTITLQHAEILEDGELCVRPLRLAQATDRYTLRGGGIETWEPRFTFHGFRYAEVTGWPGEVTADDLEAVVCHSDMERIGWFECSEPLINQLHENVIWSMRGNSLDIPSDCPQRDERLGWTGDIQIFAPTASFLYDVSGFLASWLADLAAEQVDGIVPNIVPNTLSMPIKPAAAWGDAAVIVPWVLYQRAGNRGILASQYASMTAWVDRVAQIAGPDCIWKTGFQFGDWLDPAAPPNHPEAALTDPSLVATAYFAHSSELLAQIAEILDKTTDALRYHTLAAEIREAFQRAYITPNGWLASDTPTAYALAIEFGLFADVTQQRIAGARLAELLRIGNYHILTGFVGTPLICDALCNAQAEDVAFRLLMQTTCPSWLYPVTMGATTIWERWDSLRPDGSVNPGSMTSFNHYALGAVADWLHRTVAGLAPAAPGYREITIKPRPGGGLTSARAEHQTPYGRASSSWRIAEGVFTLKVVIPPNTTALVSLPGQSNEDIHIGAGTYQWAVPYQNETTQPIFSLASTIGLVYNHQALWRRILTILTTYLPEIAERLAVEARLPWNRDVTLDDICALSLHPNPMRRDLLALIMDNG